MSMREEMRIVSAVYQVMVVTGQTKAQAFNTLKADLKTVARILDGAANEKRTPAEIAASQDAAEARIDKLLP